MPRVAHRQPRVHAGPRAGSPCVRLDQGAFGPFNGASPGQPSLSPHRGQDLTCECWGTQTSSPSPMPTPTRSPLGPVHLPDKHQTAAVLTCWEGVRTTVRATRTTALIFLLRGEGNPGRLFTV